jgi:hypothetical protein
MAPAGFELANPESEKPQTYALDCAATGIGKEYPENELNLCAKVSIFESSGT